MPSKYIAKERLWVNRDRSKIVPEGSTEAAFLLASKGKEVSEADVKRYGLAPPANKAIKESPSNKAVKE